MAQAVAAAVYSLTTTARDAAAKCRPVLGGMQTMSPVADPLIDINLDDLLDAIGLRALRGGVPRVLLRLAVQRFTGIVRAFDDRVDFDGLAAASDSVLGRLAGGLQITGRSHIPAHGPLLVLANHPGMTDTAALFASLKLRCDLRVIARDRPFLRALPHTCAVIVVTPPDAPSIAPVWGTCEECMVRT